ncbi:MAG: AMP-binding protein [Clostridia bacterium]|nr:AMP-binding protein [Clostridia bacterium]
MNLNRNYPLYEVEPMTDFRSMIEQAAEKYTDKPAISYRTKPSNPEAVRKTYREVREDVSALATALIAMGCRGQKVAIIGENSYGWACSYFATLAAGIVNIPVDKELPVADMAGILNTTACETVLFGKIDGKIAEVTKLVPSLKNLIAFDHSEIEGALSIPGLIESGRAAMEAGDRSYYECEIDVEALASIVFTSGTTGKGKGVMLSQRNLCFDISQALLSMAVTDKTLFTLPMHHTYGSTINLAGHFFMGCELYISSGLKYILNEMKAEQPKHLILVPLYVETFHKRIWSTAERQGKAKALRTLIKVSNGMRKVRLDARKLLFNSILGQFGGKLHTIICGGAPLSRELVETFDALGITLLNGYGITECSPLISCNRNLYQKDGSVGMPIVGLQVKIDRPNEDGEGEICVKGANVMLGYYNEPEATAAVFDDEGYFHTGDVGYQDDEGWIYITGRVKNLIILSNGKNVYPEEIEMDISGVYGVSEVVVYAGESKSDKSKEIIVAEIYPDYDALKLRGIEDLNLYFEDEVKKINSRSVSYKTVNRIKLRQEPFPKNSTKKITRFKIDKTVD